MSMVQAQYYEAELELKKSEENVITNKALLSPDILEIVFQHLDFFRLKICRTVCKVWNEEICRVLRRRTVSYVQTEKDFSTFQTVLNNREVHPELPELIRSLSINIHNNCLLYHALAVKVHIAKLEVSAEMDCHHLGTTNKLHSLLVSCSSTLTSLKIPFCDIGDASELRGTSEELEFPLLEELNLTVLEQNLFRGHEEVPQGTSTLSDNPVRSSKQNRAFLFFSTLIRSAPKLVGIEIRWYSGPALERMLPKLNLEKMTSIYIWTTACLDPACQALAQIKFDNLKSLSLHTRLGNIVLLPNILLALQSAAETLETFSLDHHESLNSSILQLPALRTYKVRCFSSLSWDFMSCFPNLTTVRIDTVEVVIARTQQTCPITVKRVVLGFGMNLPEGRESLRSLYRFFTPTAKAWELPCEYVEGFCDFIAAERQGRGVESLTVGSMPPVSVCLKHEYLPGFDCHWPSLRTGLESTLHLLDLKELTIINNKPSFCLSSWNLLSPQILHRLHTFTYFSSIGFAELPEMTTKLELVRKVVLLGNRPIRLDAKAEQVFSTLPNAEIRYE